MLLDSIQVVEKTYGTPELEWNRLERRRMEYAVTLRALEEHLPAAPADVVDIGGGPGRYAIELARRGYRVTLADLSKPSVDFARRKAIEVGAPLADCVKANAIDMPCFALESFDAVLMMGPLYHLIDPGHRLRAVREAYRIVKHGGVIVAAFLGPYRAHINAVANTPRYIVDDRNESEMILSTGIHRVKNPGTGFPDAWFAHPSQIEPLMAEGGFRQVALLSCEGLTTERDDQFNLLDPAVWQAWVELNYRVGHDPALHGAAQHLLYVGGKE